LEEKKIAIIDDCYNAGPNSMRAALQVLAGMPNAMRRVAILGAMKELGEWSESEHRKIGALTAGVAQVLVCVGEETRPLLEAAGDTEKHWCADANEAARLAQVLARGGDAILVKGSRSIGLEVVVNALGANE
jgi:UDP-N-acetylmuramoyl-tripeptide--D-alanyl-D-alanine ligase